MALSPIPDIHLPAVLRAHSNSLGQVNLLISLGDRLSSGAFSAQIGKARSLDPTCCPSIKIALGQFSSEGKDSDKIPASLKSLTNHPVEYKGAKPDDPAYNATLTTGERRGFWLMGIEPEEDEQAERPARKQKHSHMQPRLFRPNQIAEMWQQAQDEVEKGHCLDTDSDSDMESYGDNRDNMEEDEQRSSDQRN